MSERYRLTDSARDDLLEIWNDVFSFQGDDRRADATIDGLYRAFGLLAESPRMGTRRDKIPGGRRAFPHDDYLIVFVLLDTGTEIT